MKTRDTRSLSSDAQENQRLKAVRAVLAGKKQVEVAKLFFVTVQTVCNWVKAVKGDGFKALKAKPRGRPKGDGALKPWQAAVIVKMLQSRHPDQLKLPFCLWTREAVAQLIEQKFGIKLSIWTVGRYLKRWGFTPQKPIRKAYEQNPKEVRRWLEQEYPAIRKRAKREKVLIYWGDEMGLRSDHVAGRSYGRRGQTPEIPGTGKRFGCSMISAITNRGQLKFMVFKTRFNANIFIEFLKRLIRQTKRKIFLIVDRHPTHRSKKVQAWLKRSENIDKIELFLLPSYSPELNPDEFLNQDVKSNAVGRRRPYTQAELITNVRGYVRRRQRQPQIVKKFFEAETVRYAAN
jgi:transposase